MDKEIQQLMEMGATACQARAALKKYKDVMEAAEGVFGGEFDHISEDVQMAGPSRNVEVTAPANVTTPESNDDDDDDDKDGTEEDDYADDYIDYDSDYETKSGPAKDVDPYAGIFFSKDRREEVVEIEEEPEIVFISEMNQRVKLMTQGQWMKGCPEPGEQNHLFSLYSQLSEGECPCPHGCGASIKRKKSDFFALFSEFSQYIERLCRIVRQTCSTCHKKYCIACGEPISGEKIQRPNAAAGDEPLFHCSNLQGVILGIGLSTLEQVYADVLLEPEDQDKARTTKKRKMDVATSASQPATPGDDDDDMYWGAMGHGKGKKAKGGTGYAGEVKEDTSGQVEAQAIQRQKDEKIGQLLTQIRVYLPSLHRPGGGQTSDYLVHPTALAHLRRRFNYICSALLRNDSLSDMSDRSVLYFELFEWLETISNHEALASMMAMPIFIISSVKSVTAKKVPSRGKSTVREREIIYEGSSGPRELLESISIQAQAALKGLEGVKVPEKAEEELTEEQKRMTNDVKGKAKETSATTPSDENLKLLNFCRRILSTANGIDRALRDTKGDEFVKRLHVSLPKILTSSRESGEIHVQAGATDEALRKAYVDWATRVRFEYCDLSVSTATDGKGDDDIPHYKFYYNNDARMLANSDIPKRSLAIAKELAVLTTNLPVAWDSSIFLRVDETRVDVIKVLITGPEGTPYYNGCYLFDIFLGPSYNQSPPSVKYMTTNGGKFRFNPNLYADGKVCLSILGTWTGPSWVPGKSTLLQVLISIQSMILCEEPYLNEPGWASSGGTPQSRAYSANVRRMVVKAAMLGNLQNPPEPFAEIIRTHFRLKGRSIAAQLDQWLAQDDGKSTTTGEYQSPGQKDSAGGSSNGFSKDVADMKRAMQQLQENPRETCMGSL